MKSDDDNSFRIPGLSIRNNDSDSSKEGNVDLTGNCYLACSFIVISVEHSKNV